MKVRIFTHEDGTRSYLGTSGRRTRPVIVTRNNVKREDRKAAVASLVEELAAKIAA